jgi:predicted phage terminase large subunit-like protein
MSSLHSSPGPKEAAIEILRRRHARAGLLDFTRYTMPTYRVNWHHVLTCQYIERLLRGEIKRLMIFEPPRHGKSEIVSRRLPAYFLGRNPDAEVIACSYSSELSTSMSRDVQRIIDTRRFRNLFPNTRLSGAGSGSGGTWKRTDDLFEIVGYRGKYRSAGVGGGITGQGMNLGIIDDPVKGATEAYSPTIREKIWNWYTRDFYTRLEKDASILITMTRWHRDDLAGRLLLQAQTESDADQWTVLRLPAIRGTEDNPEDPRKLDEPLWPWKFDKAALEKTKRQDPNAWAALYDQDPRPEGGAWFDGSYFKDSIWFDQWPEDCILHTCQAMDPSLGRSETSDYGAIVTLRRRQEGAKHVLYIDADIERRDSQQSVEAAFRLGKQYLPEMFAVEAVGFQSLLVELMRAEAARTGYVLPVMAWTVDRQVRKETRIMGLAPYLANFELRFKRGSRGARMLVEQLMDFPLGKYDDGPDALEIAIRLSEHLQRGMYEEHGPSRVSA